MFRASAWGRYGRGARGPQTAGSERGGGSTRHRRSRAPSLPVAGPPWLGLVSPGRSELRRHQGEAALGYPGRGNTEGKANPGAAPASPCPGSSPWGDYKVMAGFSKPSRRAAAGPTRGHLQPFSARCCATPKPRDPPAPRLGETQNSPAGSDGTGRAGAAAGPRRGVAVTSVSPDPKRS